MAARKAAIKAVRGDITPDGYYYEDVSDDDTVFDLIEQLESVMNLVLMNF